jgi:RNA polymerase sigma factor (sigma-70 family)
VLTKPTRSVIDFLRRAALPDRAGQSDSELLGSFLERHDEAALAALVKRHGPMVWGVCRRLLSHHDAEDAFQATFLVLVRKAASIVPREMVGNWLHGVAHQTALQARRTAARRRAREVQVTEMPEPETVPQEAWAEIRPLFDQELRRLPDIYRVLIVLCDLEGRTRKEVARQLGVPEGTVAGRLARARVKLAQRLTDRGIVLSGVALTALLAQNVASAGVPASLVSETIQAASLLAVGQAAPELITAKVTALTEGVLQTMFGNKLKNLIGALMVALCLIGIGTVLALAQQPDTPRRAAPQTPQAETTAAARTGADAKPLPVGPNRLLVGRASRLTLIDPTGKNEKNLLAVRLLLDSIRLSPDGKQVAYLANDPKAPEPTALLYVAGVDDKMGQSLGVSPRAFAWSSDSTEIAFTEFPMPDKKLSAVHGIINVKTKEKTALNLPDDHYITDWSRDGTHFVTGIFLINRDGTEPRALTDKRLPAGSFGLVGRLSSDSKRLLMRVVTPSTENYKDTTRSNGKDLAVLDLATGKVMPVADVPINGEVHGYCWSPDGKQIAYTWSEVLEGKPEDLADKEIESQVVGCDPDGKNLRVISSEKGRLITISGVDWR